VLAERVAACGSLRAAAQASFNAAEGAVAKALAALPKETKGARQEYDGSDAKVTESGAPPGRVQLEAVSVKEVVRACKSSFGVFARLAQQEIDREGSGQGIKARPSFFCPSHLTRAGRLFLSFACVATVVGARALNCGPAHQRAGARHAERNGQVGAELLSSCSTF
jgi:hypothetical protein